MHTAHINGVELEYEVTGSGEPLLLISPVVADGFVPLLAERPLARYRSIRYHKRGWGGSTRTPPPVSIAEHARDAAALLDHLDVRRAHVAGHSSGGAVALQLALDRPERVHSLVLLEPSLLSVPGAKAFFGTVEPAFAAFAAGNREQALALFMSAVSGLEWEAARALLEERIPGAVASAVKDADTFFGVELPGLAAWTFDAASAAAISRPVLSVVGSETRPLWIEIAELLRAWLPRVEESKIQRVGHLLHIQRPEPVAAAIAQFLTRHPMAA